jgi:small subunit ribosomal protein S1
VFSRDLYPVEGNCFVLMPFGRKPLADGHEFDWDEHYRDVIAPEILGAQMTPIRADSIYAGPVLMDRIWRGIQEAEIVVADLTGRSPNVLYELGLAHLIGKRLLLLTMDADDIPTDLGQFAVLVYSYEGAGLLAFVRAFKDSLAAARTMPAAEAMLHPLPAGAGVEPIDAEVVWVAADCVAVKSADGRRCFLNADDVAWHRKFPDLTKRLRIGDQLHGVLVRDIRGDLKYSLIAGQENPWPKLEREFPIGESFVAAVASRPQSVGAFVHMRYGINGLLPNTVVRDHRVEVGDEVEVAPTRIDSARRRVDLQLIRVVGRSPEHGGDSFPAIGDEFDGVVSRVSQRLDYTLVRLSSGAKGLLHVTRMSDGLARELKEGNIAEGFKLRVAVTRVDRSKGQLSLRDLEPV